MSGRPHHCHITKVPASFGSACSRLTEPVDIVDKSNDTENCWLQSRASFRAVRCGRGIVLSILPVRTATCGPTMKVKHASFCQTHPSCSECQLTPGNLVKHCSTTSYYLLKLNNRLKAGAKLWNFHGKSMCNLRIHVNSQNSDEFCPLMLNTPRTLGCLIRGDGIDWLIQELINS